MFGFKRKRERAVLSYLKKTKLRLPLIEIRICAFAIIEELARCYLNRARIDYNKPDESCGWTVLIGALIAMEKAEYYCEIKTSRMDARIVETYEGFLLQGIPAKELLMIN